MLSSVPDNVLETEVNASISFDQVLAVAVSFSSDVNPKDADTRSIRIVELSVFSDNAAKVVYFTVVNESNAEIVISVSFPIVCATLFNAVISFDQPFSLAAVFSDSVNPNASEILSWRTIETLMFSETTVNVVYLTTSNVDNSDIVILFSASANVFATLNTAGISLFQSILVHEDVSMLALSNAVEIFLFNTIDLTAATFPSTFEDTASNVVVLITLKSEIVFNTNLLFTSFGNVLTTGINAFISNSQLEITSLSVNAPLFTRFVLKIDCNDIEIGTFVCNESNVSSLTLFKLLISWISISSTFVTAFLTANVSTTLTTAVISLSHVELFHDSVSENTLLISLFIIVWIVTDFPVTVILSYFSTWTANAWTNDNGITPLIFFTSFKFTNPYSSSGNAHTRYLIEFISFSQLSFVHPVVSIEYAFSPVPKINRLANCFFK